MEGILNKMSPYPHRYSDYSNLYDDGYDEYCEKRKEKDMDEHPKARVWLGQKSLGVGDRMEAITQMRYIPNRKSERFTCWHRRFRTIAFGGLVFKFQRKGSQNKIHALDAEKAPCLWIIPKGAFYFKAVKTSRPER